MFMLDRILNIFTFRKEERLPALVAFVYFCFLNTLNVMMYWGKFSVPLEQSHLASSYHRLFVNNYRVSGFDPLTYEVLSQWFPAYDVHRHPLLAFFMWPVNQLNQGLMMATGVNLATVLTAVVLVVCSVYSFVFLFRILRNVIEVTYGMTLVLLAMYFTMGFVMLSSMVPDHFVMSECCLLLTLWLSGEKLKRGSALNMWQTIALFVVTAGVSLNNGLKVFLAALITRRRRFFEWRFLLFALALPAALMWGIARWEYKTWRLPREKARSEQVMKKDMEAKERLRKVIADTISDPSKIEVTLKQERNRLAKEKYRKDHQQIWNKNAGKPMGKGEFMRWTDKSTDRWTTAVENLFGEAIQLHRDYVLHDVLKNRPVFVYYHSRLPLGYVNYFVEALIVILFLMGIWLGRRSLFMWTAMSMFLMDMTLHMGLGFGINEIYIMSVHYLFVIPIAIGYLIKAADRSHLPAICTTLLVITLWLLAWNGSIILEYT